MKAQTRTGAAIETGVNLVVGFALTWAANKWILPWWGFYPPASFLWTIGGVMTVISIARQYTLRRIFEWLRIRNAPPAFLYIAEELAAERLRQINGEGYDLAHDDKYTRAELQRAAGWYALASATYRNDGFVSGERLFADPDMGWPWDEQFWKSESERRDLVKSGALIIAAIGRIDRARNVAAKSMLQDGIIDAAEHDRMIGATP